MTARTRLSLLLLAALACAAPAPRPAALADGRLVMGTVLEIEVPEPPDALLSLEPYFAHALALEAVFSRFRPESALVKLNQAAGAGPQAVPDDLLRVLEDSARWSEATQGAFDVTVGPLIELWTAAAERGRRPDAAELERARARVGAAKILLDPRSGMAGLALAGMSLDLGAIAKGWALDELQHELRENRVEHALLSFGGSSLYALGAPPGESGWRVLVRDAQDGFCGVATLRDQALSISASLGQHFLIEGERYGHIVDPRTGQPLRTRRLAAVVAPRGADAEALSTALLVLEPVRGMALLEQTGEAEGLIVDATGERWQSSGWPSAVRFAAPPEEL